MNQGTTNGAAKGTTKGTNKGAAKGKTKGKTEGKTKGKTKVTLASLARKGTQGLQGIVPGLGPEKTDVNAEESDEMAKKMCGCNLCPRSDQSKDGGGGAYKGPFQDPTGQKDRFVHEAQGTRKDPFNRRTDLPPPRERFDPNKMLRDRYNSGGAGMAAGAMGSLLRL